MATSNSTNFTMTANELISDALRLIDVLGAGENVNADDYALALRQLNMMIKTMQTEGCKLWTETEAIVFLEPSQQSYVLGGSAPDKASSEEIKTELSVAAIATATTLTVDSTAGMAASDKIGIVQDDGTTHWTTIVSVDSSTTLTITAGLVSGAAIDQHVYAYTTDVVKPMDISSVRITNKDGYDDRCTKLSRSDYFMLQDKATVGKPRFFYYDRQRDNGTLYLYPVSDDAENRARITFSREIQDFDASTDTPDLPSEWLQALLWNLAIELSPFFGREDKAAKFASKAFNIKQALLDYDSETASLKVR